MDIYADVLFFLNFLFDAEILAILCKLYSKKIPPFRFLLSTCLGGVWGVFAFIPYFEILAMPPAGLIMPLLMVMTVFLPDRKERIAGAWIGFCAVSFIFSGAVNYFGLGVYYALLLPAPLYVAIAVLKGNIRQKRKRALLKYGDRKYTAEGFFDSGNTLSSGGAPVMIADIKIFEGLFGKGFTMPGISEWVDESDIRYVPYSSVGKNGVMLGVRIDSAEIGTKKYENAVLAYSGDRLSEELILNGVMT